MNISLVIDRFENGKAILKTNDNDTIIWPKNKLPENLQEGSVLNFNITNDKNEEVNKKNLAKDILNEILNPDDEK